MTDDELGQIAWDTYSKAVGGKAFSGDPLPTWETMCKDEKKQNLVVAWKRTGRAVALAYAKSLPKPEVPKVAPFSVVGVPSGRSASNAPTIMPAPSRPVSPRTKCCGSTILTLVTGRYICPCGDHIEAL